MFIQYNHEAVEKEPMSLLDNLTVYLPFDDDYIDRMGNVSYEQSADMIYDNGIVNNGLKPGGRYLQSYDTDVWNFWRDKDDTNPFTISFRMNNKENSQFFLSMRSGNFNQRERQAYIYSNYFRFAIMNQTDATGYGVVVGIPMSELPDGRWNAVITRDGNSYDMSGLKMYLNGQLVSQGSGSVTDIAKVSTKMKINGTGWGRNLNMRGSLDELAMWKDRALTASEVQELYELQLAGNSII